LGAEVKSTEAHKLSPIRHFGCIERGGERIESDSINRWLAGAFSHAKPSPRLIPRKGMSFQHTQGVSEKGSINGTSDKWMGL
jgi:hypothetical protein